MDLALNNLQKLICHKTKQTKPNILFLSLFFLFSFLFLFSFFLFLSFFLSFSSFSSLFLSLSPFLFLSMFLFSFFSLFLPFFSRTLSFFPIGSCETHGTDKEHLKSKKISFKVAKSVTGPKSHGKSMERV